MKKAIVILLVLLTLGTAAFAGGFTLRGGFAYDLINIKSAESADETPERQDNAAWKANAFGAEFGITYDFSDTTQIYADTAIGFFNTLKIGDTEIKIGDRDNMSLLSTSEHVGFAYGIKLSNDLKLYVGAGLAHEYVRLMASWTNPLDKEQTKSVESGIFAFGFGLYGNLDYKLSKKFALSLTVHPDFMIVSGDHIANSTSTVHDKTVASTTSSWTTFGAVFSFKLNASVGAKFMF